MTSLTQRILNAKCAQKFAGDSLEPGSLPYREAGWGPDPGAHGDPGTEEREDVHHHDGKVWLWREGASLLDLLLVCVTIQVNLHLRSAADDEIDAKK